MATPNVSETAVSHGLPLYPCDICRQEVVPGERVHISDGGLTVEHVACASAWFRRNFGREGLS